MAPRYSLMPDSWPDLARALVAELIGTMLLVIIGCGAAVNWKTSFDVTQVRIILILLCHQLLVKAYQKLHIVTTTTQPNNHKHRSCSGVTGFWVGRHGHR